MVYVIGASSLRYTVDKSPYWQRRRIFSRTFAVPGLSLNPNAKNYLKNLENLLDSGYLRHRTDLVIWHDLINNTLSQHRSNNYNACSVEQLLGILSRYKHRIAAIVYIQRERTPYVFRQLCLSGILILPVEKLLSPRKRRNVAIRSDFVTVHPKTPSEQRLLQTVLRNGTNLRKLVNRRSKGNGPSQEQRETTRVARSNLVITVTFNWNLVSDIFPPPVQRPLVETWTRRASRTLSSSWHGELWVETKPLRN